MKYNKNFDFDNIKRMREIAEVYDLTKQKEKSEKYHNLIISICDKYPKNEEMLIYKISSLNYLNKPYKSLETTNELLNLNPYNLIALLNIAEHLRGDIYV